MQQARRDQATDDTIPISFTLQANAPCRIGPQIHTHSNRASHTYENVGSTEITEGSNDKLPMIAHHASASCNLPPVIIMLLRWLRRHRLPFAPHRKLRTGQICSDRYGKCVLWVISASNLTSVRPSVLTAGTYTRSASTMTALDARSS